MVNLLSNLVQGIVIETKTQSWTGSVLYSDFAWEARKASEESEFGGMPVAPVKQSVLNKMARVPLFGTIAGVIRVGLACIHTVGHLFLAIVTLDAGHLSHAAKGVCECLRGCIESIPIIGNIFAWCLVPPTQSDKIQCSWWIIKIYNPEDPDGLDRIAGDWNNLYKSRPDAYYRAPKALGMTHWVSYPRDIALSIYALFSLSLA